MKKLITPLKLILIALSAGALVSRAQVTNSWIGGGPDDNWSDSQNWATPNVSGIPNPGDVLDFIKSAYPPINDITGTNGYSGITFDATADGSFDLTGNPISFAGVIENDSTAAQAIDLSIALTNNATINATSGEIDIGLNGLGIPAISGTNSLTVNGPGLLVLSNATYSGGTTVGSTGNMQIENDNGNYTLAGGTLELTYGSWYSTANYAFTADSSLGVIAGGPNYNIGAGMIPMARSVRPAFKWTVVGTGRFQIFGHVAAGSVEVTSGAVLGALANGSANITGFGNQYHHCGQRSGFAHQQRRYCVGADRAGRRAGAG